LDRNYLPLGESIELLARSVRTSLRVEKTGVRLAYKRVLAGDVVAARDAPLRDLSHFDGFAVTSGDTISASPGSPVTLGLRRGVRLGLAPRAKLGRGEAMAVLTGGILPAGADAVAPVEEVFKTKNEIRLEAPVEAGAHVYRAGSDVRRGDTLLKKGKTLMGQDIALLASLHIPTVAAFKRPIVSIIPTGDELTSKISGSGGKVVESHSLMLERLIEEAGGEAHTLPIVADDGRAIAAALSKALKRSDVVLTLAGSSVGERDLVESALQSFGEKTTALVHGVRVNRGRVMGYAVVGGKPVVMLPGPIQGALNAFIVLVYPLIRHDLGMGWEEPPAIWPRMAEDWQATGKYREFDQVVYLTLAGDPSNPGGLLAIPSAAETEKVSFLVTKNAYALVPGKEPLLKGERVRAHLLPGFSMLE
jgi:molybdenum cofactor synthesis domain-containing protein